jgi:hypothetical protein
MYFLSFRINKLLPFLGGGVVVVVVVHGCGITSFCASIFHTFFHEA